MNYKRWPDISSFSTADKVRLVFSGGEYFKELVSLIASAKRELHLQVYIFQHDETGIYIAEHLKNAASRGVAVFVVTDGYGSASLPDSFVRELRNAGVNFRFHSLKFGNIFSLGRRLHQKVAVADKQYALIGGINIADKYKGNETDPPWLDFALYIEGEEACENIYRLCRHIWRRRKKYARTIQKSWKHERASSHVIPVKVQLNDWLRGRTAISSSYRTAIRKSQLSLFITASYFIPGLRVRRYLRRASRRGVKIKLLLPGISDVPLARAATLHLYRFLFRHNIEIYQWKKSVLHGKLAIVDGKWMTVGSYNLNHMSDYGSIEINAEVADEEIVRSSFIRIEQEILDHCDYIEKRKFHEPVLLQFRNWCAYRLVRMLFAILYFFTRKGE